MTVHAVRAARRTTCHNRPFMTSGSPTFTGKPLDLAQFRGVAALVVNVASRVRADAAVRGVGELHERYADRGFSVLGVPCNQFGGQEPGTADEIAEFC